jgi:hypothetical protein
MEPIWNRHDGFTMGAKERLASFRENSRVFDVYVIKAL